MSDRLESMLERHEGNRRKPYLDCCAKVWRECRCKAKGKLTVGIGRNLDDVGITDAEARTMCRYDIEDKRTQLRRYDWFNSLSEVRQDVVIDMAFNMGVGGISQFKNMIECLKKKDFPGAATEMHNSHWAQQVGDRAVELVAMMVTDRYVK